MKLRVLQVSALALLCCWMSGCSHFHAKPSDQYVYVTAKQTFLRDRVAAVSNRTGNVSNGDRLKVLERGRRFLRVQTDKNEVGWIDERAIATEQTFADFDKLRKEHEKSPVVATGVVRDEVNLHIKPGRDTDKFYRLVEGEKLKLLERATLPKTVATAPVLVPHPSSKALAAKKAAAPAKEKVTAAADAPLPPAMEDWWLVRDSQNHTGWLLSRMMDVDAPDAITRYAEGQRIVAAYVLTTVNDPDALTPASDDDAKAKNGKHKLNFADAPPPTVGQGPQKPFDPNIPIYVVVLSPYKAGLVYDFDQVRVFTWSLKKHRYETAFREKNIEGFLPVTISQQMPEWNGKGQKPTGTLPTFSYRVLSDEAGPVIPDPVTGEIKPGKTITKTYHLDGNVVKRALAAGQQAGGEARPEPAADKKKSGKKKK